MGKPVPRNGGTPEPEFIGLRGDTRGSETSQYPEERKTTVIPSVAASESGKAQTLRLVEGGCGTFTMASEG